MAVISNHVLDLKNEISELNLQIAYNLSVKQRMEQERKYVGDDNCTIMMSAIDRKVLQEVHVPICLEKDLSLEIIDCVIKYSVSKVKELKEKSLKLKKELDSIESKNKNKNIVV